MEKLIAYHNSADEKAIIIAQLEKHRAEDALIKGAYWENGKGCAVGCTIHSCDHAQYEPRFGIPQMLARLEDCIFEGLPNDKAKEWPIRFMMAIKPGANLSLVGWKFLHWILTDEKVNPCIKDPIVKDAVAQAAEVICAISKGEPLNEMTAREAESARDAARSAWAVARLAESAVWAAWVAGSARLAESARDAARSAWAVARLAESAVWAAREAESARDAARSAWAVARLAESAVWAAREAPYELMAERLIELLEIA